MKCPGCQIYTVTSFRLTLDIATERAHGAFGGLLEMGSKLGSDRRLWYLVTSARGILKYSWPKPLRDELWLLRLWRRRLKGPTDCWNMWESCKALLPQESGRTGPGGNDWLRIKNVLKTGERQNKHRLYSHFFLQKSTPGSFMLRITSVFSSFSCFTHLSGSLIGQQCGANPALHNKVAIAFDPKN